MDEYCDRTYDGWSEGLAAAEARCVKVWVGDREVWAVLQTDLVQLRRLPELAKRAVES